MPSLGPGHVTHDTCYRTGDHKEVLIIADILQKAEEGPGRG